MPSEYDIEICKERILQAIEDHDELPFFKSGGYTWEADVHEALSQLESIRGEAIGSQLARTSARLIDLK